MTVDHAPSGRDREPAAPAPLMAGKTVIITGGTSGIGKATAIGLGGLGARVVITGRDRARADAAAAEIRSAARGTEVAFVVADLSSQIELRSLAAQLLASYPRIDVLINNVGGFWGTRRVTSDGLEHTFALNHLAPFLLTNLLVERLRLSAPARIVTVASGAHTAGRIDFDDLQGERGYSGSRAYSQSKLGNILFTHALSAQLADSGVTANALHPGVVRTSFGSGDPGRIQKWLVPFMRPFMKTPEQGAATSIHVASAPELAKMSGQYFANGKPKRSSDASYDEAVAARLWDVSAGLVGLQEPV